MLNINEQALKNKKVKINEIYTIFSPPNKSDLKTIKEILKKDFKSFSSATEEFYFGYFINVPEYSSASNVIGILPKKEI